MRERKVRFTRKIVQIKKKKSKLTNKIARKIKKKYKSANLVNIGAIVRLFDRSNRRMLERSKNQTFKNAR